MDEEDDAPPLLVGEDGLVPKSENGAGDESNAARVPITIITGMQSCVEFVHALPMLTMLNQDIWEPAKLP
jgi:hypothetical protein